MNKKLIHKLKSSSKSICHYATLIMIIIFIENNLVSKYELIKNGQRFDSALVYYGFSLISK